MSVKGSSPKQGFLPKGQYLPETTNKLLGDDEEREGNHIPRGHPKLERTNITSNEVFQHDVEASFVKAFIVKK